MSRKIGEGHLDAMVRLGFRELRNAFNPSRESVADTEIGLYGTATQGEIGKARGLYGLDADQERSQQQTSVLGYSLEGAAQAAQSMDQQRGQEQSRSRGR
jgi:hypothetical protein